MKSAKTPIWPIPTSEVIKPFICLNCLPKPKSLGFWWKKASLGVRSPRSVGIPKKLQNKSKRPTLGKMVLQSPLLLAVQLNRQYICSSTILLRSQMMLHPENNNWNHFWRAFWTTYLWVLASYTCKVSSNLFVFAEIRIHKNRLILILRPSKWSIC